MKKIWWLLVDAYDKPYPPDVDWKFICPSRAKARSMIRDEEDGWDDKDRERHGKLRPVPLKLLTR